MKRASAACSAEREKVGEEREPYLPPGLGGFKRRMDAREMEIGVCRWGALMDDVPCACVLVDTDRLRSLRGWLLV